jgi:endonuclease-3 related protein
MQLEDLYTILFDHFGPQHWWPGDTPFEVMVGAVLTQNTNWQNVSRAITNLKEADILSLEVLATLDHEILAEYIRPAGYFRLKTTRLKNLFSLITNEFDGNLDALFALDTQSLRQALLSVKGIGPETADSIALYAADKPTFVVDTYTHRILSRHNLIDDDSDYYTIQELFLDSLEEDTKLFNEYHALLVRLGKDFCKKSNPRCKECPLKTFLPD